MSGNHGSELTERQRRERDYHRDRAREHEAILSQPFSWDVLHDPSRRWWNAYWQMYEYLTKLDLKGRKVLVVGCGFGEDALRMAKLGAEVSAFDLSPDSLGLARKLALREGLTVSFEEMPAEALTYPDDCFDCIIARDILHHVDIPRAMGEIRRVAKDGAILVVNEVYSHTLTNRIRHSRLVVQWLYPRMTRFVYGHAKPYITEDERKLTESDMHEITRPVARKDLEKHFNFLLNRILPGNSETLAKIDRLLLILLKPLGNLIAGRVLVAGRVAKPVS